MSWTKYLLSNILDKVTLGSVQGLSLGDSVGSLGFSVGLGGSVGLSVLVVVGLRGGRWVVNLLLLNVAVSIISVEEEASIKVVDDGSGICVLNVVVSIFSVEEKGSIKVVDDGSGICVVDVIAV